MNDVKNAAQLLGSKGGKATKKSQGKDFFKKIGELGVKARREAVLKSFTLEDLNNPKTAESVREKLEQLDNLNGS